MGYLRGNLAPEGAVASARLRLGGTDVGVARAEENPKGRRYRDRYGGPKGARDAGNDDADLGDHGPWAKMWR